MDKKHLASLVCLFAFSSAHAKVIYSSGDWKLDDLSSKKVPNDLCIAYTESTVGRQTYRLEFTHAKGVQGPTEVLVRVQGTGAATSYTLALRDESLLSFVSVGEVAKKQFLHWNIPQHTRALIDQLDNRRDVRIRPADGSRDPRIEFSADGFKRVREKLEEKCLNKSPIFDQEFDDKFVINRQPLEPSKISIDQAKELRRILNVGYSIHAGISQTRLDIGALQGKFQTQLNEKSSLENRITTITNSEIPSILNSQQQNDSQESSAMVQIQQLVNTIATQQKTLAQAQAQFDSAYKIIQPHMNEHESRSENLAQAQNSYNWYSNRVTDINMGIASGNSKIEHLNYEVNSLRGEIPRLERDLRSASQERTRAEMDLRQFNPRHEMDRRLSSNGSYISSQRELERIDNELRMVQRNLQNARRRLQDEERNLRQCQTRTSYTQKSALNRFPAQIRPGRPGQPNDPNRPTEPTRPSEPSTPTVDCSSQEREVSSARSIVSSLESDVRSAENRRNSVARTMDSIEGQVRNQVDSTTRDLQGRVSHFASQEQSIYNRLDSIQRRMETIVQVEIPQIQNNIYTLQNEKPEAIAGQQQAQNQVRQLQSELNTFENKVGWRAKKQAYDNAEALVEQRSNELARSQSTKSNLEAQISRNQNERARLSSLLQDTKNRKAQAEQRLTQVIQSLVPYENERARLERQLLDLPEELSATAQQFESQIP